MKVRMRTLSAGPDGVRQAGRVYEVPKDEGEELIDRGFADPAGKDDIEEATAGASETAARRPSKRAGTGGARRRAPAKPEGEDGGGENEEE
jgi:hypothetical protein